MESGAAAWGAVAAAAPAYGSGAGVMPVALPRVAVLPTRAALLPPLLLLLLPAAFFLLLLLLPAGSYAATVKRCTVSEPVQRAPVQSGVDDTSSRAE
jgi:hypothetical protein